MAGKGHGMMNSTANLDLSKVYRNCVFQSRSAVASHAQLSQELARHDLDWGRGSVDTALFRAEGSRMSFFVLRYGAEVQVRPEPFKGFALVQMPLRGAAHIECDGTHLSVEPGQAALVAPRRQIRLRWERNCEQLLLRVPHALLREFSCCSGALAQGDPHGPLAAEWESAFVLHPAVTAQWRRLVQQLLDFLPAPGDAALDPAWLQHFEQTVALFLLAHRPAALAADAEGGSALVMPAGAMRQARRALEAVEEYIRSRPYAPISLADLVQASGVSARKLNVLCHRLRGVTPMLLLRQVRLDAARARLLADPRASVTEVALEYGFGHLGRFSAYYRERFGELPRDRGMLRH